VLGAADIAARAMLPALSASRNGEVVAIASRTPDRARDLARRHGIRRAHADYDALLADPEVDAVYVPLPNSLHREWSQRALAQGKHVLCEKPLAMDAAEAEAMASSARCAGRLLMEAVMYRFHPRLRELVARLRGVRYLHAGFGFPISAPENYRMRPEMGGGALLDVGCYLVDVARWVLGEPVRVEATAHLSGVDLSFSALLAFSGGEQASLYGSFETAEYQELTVVSRDGVVHVDKPFTAWRDPHDPYQLMVEAFADAVLGGEPAPLPLAGSVANLRVLDRIRAASGLPPPHPPAPGERRRGR
jgi:xylose dehydrogenase (NAD/NADP)